MIAFAISRAHWLLISISMSVLPVSSGRVLPYPAEDALHLGEQSVPMRQLSPPHALLIN